MGKRAAKGILLLLIIACLGLALIPNRPVLVPQDLLLDDPGLPSRWDSEKGPAHVTWQRVPSIGPSEPDPYFFAGASAIGIWSDHGERSSAINVHQSVYSYRTPIQAVLSYYIGMPEFRCGDYCPNFTFDYGASRRYPPDWSYKSPFADQEHVVCGMGTLEACQRWYYRARYGQYVMEAGFFGPDRPMRANLFQQIVSEIDAYVGKKLTP